ncbi:MAG: transporter [Ramlibacter sp.]|jgi:predicted MFS family arabinose efflux permease|nr:transporter [Ramlibacter sp.]
MYRILLWAAVGTFAIGTESFVIAGVLAELSQDLSVSPSQAGQLVTAYALVYAVAAPVMATLTSGWKRETVMRAAMALFVLGNAAAALAPDFAALLAARLVLALCAGTFSPVAAAWAGAAVVPELRGRALAFVMAGVAVSTVAGVPVATWVGRTFGWRATFVLVAALALVAFVGLCRPRPSQPAAAPASIAQRIAWLRTPAIAHALIVTWLTFTGAFCVYTYLAPLTHAIAGPLLTGHLPLVLAAFGAAAVVGSLTGGHLADRFGARFVIPRALLLVATAYGALGVLAGSPGWSADFSAASAVLLLVLWGLVGWQLPAAQQLNLIQLAPQAAPVVLSLQGSALYLGVSTGALVGSFALKTGSPSLLGWIGAGCELLALLVWVAYNPLRTPQARTRSADFARRH